MEKQKVFIPVDVKEELPELNKQVWLLHEDSGNRFSDYRTNDCTTGEERWQNDSMPTHWLKEQIEIINDQITLYEIPFGGGEPIKVGEYTTLIAAFEAANLLT